MKKNYIPNLSVYYDEHCYNRYEAAIQQAIQKFRAYYSKFDKRLLTTKKQFNIDLTASTIRVTIDFNLCYYSQIYQIVSTSCVENYRYKY